MGILVSVIVGMALTLPISSAAICAALSLTGLAGGAALAGCCAQMVGFAVLSFRENRWNGIISQGLGTSMLQMGNIVKNPKIWLAPIMVSAKQTGHFTTAYGGVDIVRNNMDVALAAIPYAQRFYLYDRSVHTGASVQFKVTGLDPAGLTHDHTYDYGQYGRDDYTD